MSTEDVSLEQVSRAKVADSAPHPFETRWPYIVSSLGFVIFICILLGLIFFSFANSANSSYRVELLADFGEFLGAASAVFTGLAFVGVCTSIPFLVAQVRAARHQVEAALDQVKISNRQALIADQTNKDTSRQALFVALSQRVGEVISDDEIRKMPAIREAPVNGRLSLRDTVDGQLVLRISGMSNDDFLGFASESLKLGPGTSQAIPLHDRFRRQSLFRALRSLLSDSTGFQKQLFIDALNAQIHDEAARMLIFKSIVELDRETLKTYAWLGIKFDLVHQYPILMNELKRRFPGRGLSAEDG
jgi:hypothetical protein